MSRLLTGGLEHVPVPRGDVRTPCGAADVPAQSVIVSQEAQEEKAEEDVYEYDCPRAVARPPPTRRTLSDTSGPSTAFGALGVDSLETSKFPAPSRMWPRPVIVRCLPPLSVCPRCVSRSVCSRWWSRTPPETSPATSQLWPKATTCKPGIFRSVAGPPSPSPLLLLPLPLPLPLGLLSACCRSRKSGPQWGDRVPDVSGLLHPGYPESSDDRPEQPGDCQEYPERVCLRSIRDAYRHIVDRLAPLPEHSPCYHVSICPPNSVGATHYRTSVRRVCRPVAAVHTASLHCVHVISGLFNLLSNQFNCEMAFRCCAFRFGLIGSLWAVRVQRRFIPMCPERSTDVTRCLLRHRGALKLIGPDRCLWTSVLCVCVCDGCVN